MAAELSLVPEPALDGGDGDGGDGEESNLDDLVYLAELLLNTSARKIDWTERIAGLRDAAAALTEDDADFSTLLYLMNRARIEFVVEIEGIEDLS